ncbi:MAG: hypothetical protein NZL96_01840 [Patescibacteria group bacterium]|nr:hypothetical protein [Patescibacteria group bacterium]
MIKKLAAWGVLLLVFLLPFQIIFLYLSLETEADKVAGIYQQNFGVTNSAFIGDFFFNLFGYTSPFAEVSFLGQGIADKTVADEKGYFEFKNRFSPLSPREACLSAKDQFGRISAPVCLPSFPTQYNVTIGPVILPPTISFDKKNYFIGDKVILTGQTVPNSEINLSFFTDEKLSSFFSRKLNLNLIKDITAFSLPRITIVSDEKGNFSVTLPSSISETYRVFTQVIYQERHSPNSIVLSLRIEPVWVVIVKFLKFFWEIIKLRIIEFLVLIESILLILYFIKIFHDLTDRQTSLVIYKERSIVLYQRNLPALRRET